MIPHSSNGTDRVAKCDKQIPSVKKPSKPRAQKVPHVKQLARDLAEVTGMMPHEILLSIARGEGISHKVWVSKRDKKGTILRNDDGHEIQELVERIHYADFAMRMDAAKAAAPFYAPRLAAQQVNIGATNPEDIVTTMQQLAERLPV